MHNRLWLPLTLLALLALVACGRGIAAPREMPDDGPPIPVSEEAAASLLRKGADAAQTATNTGASSLTVTQEEVTSALALSAQLPERMATMEAEAAAQAEQDTELVNLPRLDVLLTLEEPQVYFKGDGTIIIRGFIEFRGRRQPLRVVTRPRGESGQLQLDFVEGFVGPVSMPSTLFNQLGGLVSRLLLLGQDYAEITDLRVEEGTLTVAGRKS